MADRRRRQQQDRPRRRRTITPTRTDPTPAAPAAPPCARPGSTARGSTRCRWIRPSSRSASTPGSWTSPTSPATATRSSSRSWSRPRSPTSTRCWPVGHRGHDPGGHGHRRCAPRSLARQGVRRRAATTSAAINRLEASSRRSAARSATPKPRNTLITDTKDVVRQLRGIPDAPAPADLGITPTRCRGRAAPPVRAAVGAGPQRQPGVQGPRLLQPPGRRLVPPPGDRGRRGRDPGAGRASTTSTSTSGTRSTRTQARRTRRSRAPPTWPSTRSSSATRRWATTSLNTAYTMKDGTVVNEQDRVPGVHPGRRRLRRAARAPTTRCTTGGWYKDFLGGLFVSHPANQNGFAPDCGSCYWAEVDTEDRSHPSMAAAGVPKSVAVSDELYHFDRKPRAVRPRRCRRSTRAPTWARWASAPTRPTSRAAITRSSGARTTTAAASGRRCSATTGSSTGPRRGSARASTRAS